MHSKWANALVPPPCANRDNMGGSTIFGPRNMAGAHRLLGPFSIQWRGKAPKAEELTEKKIYSSASFRRDLALTCWSQSCFNLLGYAGIRPPGMV